MPSHTTTTCLTPHKCRTAPIANGEPFLPHHMQMPSVSAASHSRMRCRRFTYVGFSMSNSSWHRHPLAHLAENPTAALKTHAAASTSYTCVHMVLQKVANTSFKEFRGQKLAGYDNIRQQECVQLL